MIPRTRRGGRWSVWALASLTGFAPSAWAQTGPLGWALDRHEPSPAGDVFFLAEHPWYRGTRRVAAGITLGYAAGPLGLRIPRDGMPALERDVVSGMLTGHLGASLSPFDRLGLHLSFPVALQQSGTAIPSGAGNVGPAAGMAPGDLRAGLRVRVAGDADRNPWSLHLGALLWIPTGSPSGNTGDGAARVEPRVVVAGRVSALRWSVGVGFQVRGAVSALNLAVGSELRATAALGLGLLGGRLNVGPEGYVFTSVGDLPGARGNAAFRPGHWGAEAMLGARWRFAGAVQVGLAGGFGIGDGYGIPQGRALLSVVYAPEGRPRAPRDAVTLAATPAIDPPPMAPAVAVAPVVAAAPAVAPDPGAARGAEAGGDGDGGARTEAPGAVAWPLDPVGFRTHRAEIAGGRSFRALDAVAAILRSRADLEVDVQVHTRHRRNPGFYRDLTGRRAETVRRYLIDRGVPAARLHSHGMGAACSDLPRVQFVIVSAGSPPGRCARQDPPGEAPARGRRRDRARHGGTSPAPVRSSARPWLRVGERLGAVVVAPASDLVEQGASDRGRLPVREHHVGARAVDPADLGEASLEVGGPRARVTRLGHALVEPRDGLEGVHGQQHAMERPRVGPEG